MFSANRFYPSKIILQVLCTSSRDLAGGRISLILNCVTNIMLYNGAGCVLRFTFCILGFFYIFRSILYWLFFSLFFLHNLHKIFKIQTRIVQFDFVNMYINFSLFQMHALLNVNAKRFHRKSERKRIILLKEDRTLYVPNTPFTQDCLRP